MKARWSDQRLLHQHLWDLWYKWTLLIQQRGKRTKDGENINDFSRVHVYFSYEIPIQSFQNGPPTQNKCGGSSWCFIGWSNLTKSHCNTMHWKLDNWQTDMWKNINAFWPRSPSHDHTRKGLRNSNLHSLSKSVMKLLESKLSKDLQGVFDENICKEKLHSLFWAQTISRKIFLVFRWVLLKNPEDLIRFWLNQTQIKFCVGKIRKI